MIEIIKLLSPKQKFLGFLLLVCLPAVTSLGTAYLKGSDCGEIADKYSKSIKNYNELIQITDETQQKYLQAKRDILEIQDKITEMSGILESSNTRRINMPERVLQTESYHTDTVMLIQTTPQPNKQNNTRVIVKTQAPEGAKRLAGDIMQITDRYKE